MAVSRTGSPAGARGLMLMLGLVAACITFDAWSLVVRFDVVIDEKFDRVPSSDGTSIISVEDDNFTDLFTRIDVEFDPTVISIDSDSGPLPGGGVFTLKRTGFGPPSMTASPVTGGLKSLQRTDGPNIVRGASSSNDSFVESPGSTSSARTFQLTEDEIDSEREGGILSEWMYFMLLGVQETGLFDSPDDLEFLSTTALIEMLLELEESDTLFGYSEFGQQSDFSELSERYESVDGSQYFGYAGISEIVGRVPEPGSLLLLGIGLLVLAVFALRGRG